MITTDNGWLNPFVYSISQNSQAVCGHSAEVRARRPLEHSNMGPFSKRALFPRAPDKREIRSITVQLLCLKLLLLVYDTVSVKGITHNGDNIFMKHYNSEIRRYQLACSLHTRNGVQNS
ncbi:hypothetical protein EVAR_26802_1 [Eumeta japonica]|uniref:Uncharacterized protein n=1 Tax=Eumeta variegata TaxID=151549 RepID=A0A4C1WG18_EUMVA|nr:hypothetical protein EVAR_26802_1 [Eumeta japonica]